MNEKTRLSKIKEFLFPNYDELALFLYSGTALLFIAFNFKLLWDSLLLTIQEDTVKQILLSFLVILIVLAIIALPVYHGFSKRAKKPIEKRLMLFVVVIVDFIVAWNVYDVLKTEITNWEIIFPVFNAVHSSLILFGYRYEIVNSTMISDEHAKLRDVIISGLLLCILFWFYHTILQKDWSITFSMCIFYAAVLNRGVFYLIKYVGSWFAKK